MLLQNHSKTFLGIWTGFWAGCSSKAREKPLTASPVPSQLHPTALLACSTKVPGKQNPQAQHPWTQHPGCSSGWEPGSGAQVFPFFSATH